MWEFIISTVAIFVFFGIIFLVLDKYTESKERKLKNMMLKDDKFYNIKLNFIKSDEFFDDVLISMLYVHNLNDNKNESNSNKFEIVFDGKYENDKLVRLVIVDGDKVDIPIVREKLKKQLEKLKKNHPKFYTQRYELAEKLLNSTDEYESKRLIARYKNDNVVDFYKDADFNFSDYEIKRVTEHKYKFINVKGKTIVDNIYVEYEDEFSFGERMNKLECFRGTHYFKVPEDKYYRDEWNHRNKIEKIQDGVFAVWHNDISTFSPQRYDDKYNILIGYYVRCDVDFDVNEWLEKQKEELGYDVTKVNKLDE
jgi:hypothetical protein